MREFFLNADFDLSLGGKPPLLVSAEATYAHEMAWHFPLAAEAGDTLIAHRPLPEGFLAYAGTKGLALPRIVVPPAFTAEAVFSPFGWNAQAIRMSMRYAKPPAFPDPAAVKTANSRAFALALEREEFPEGCGGRLFSDFASMAGFLATRSPAESWLAKGEHGYAGTANRRVPGGPLAALAIARLEPLFAEGARVVLEPWHDRELDMALLFEAAPGGKAEGFRGHTLINSRDGAFLGVEVAPDALPPAPWREGLLACAARLAPALAAIGYHGPVGVDAYVHRTPAGPRFRPWVDINARLSMALPAHGLARRLPGRYVRWSWHKPRKLRMPESYADLDRRLGASAFSPEAGEGILAVSPLFREDDSGLRPKRAGFALIARDRASLDRLQSAFAAALGRASGGGP